MEPYFLIDLKTAMPTGKGNWFSMGNIIRIINDRFYEHFMNLNARKSHFMCIGKHIDDTGTLTWELKIIKK